VTFARELKEPAFAPREVLAGKDARTFARDLLAMTQENFSAAFKGSPMKRAKLRGLKRNAAVVLGNRGIPDRSTDPASTGAAANEQPVARLTSSRAGALGCRGSHPR
jgi:epoxyqueuosine reductase QueG